MSQFSLKPAAQPVAQPEEQIVIPETPTPPQAAEVVESTEAAASPKPSEEMDQSMDRDKIKRAVDAMDKEEEPKAAEQKTPKKTT